MADVLRTNVNSIRESRLDRVAQSVAHVTQEPEIDTRSGHILSFFFPLIQAGQLSDLAKICARSTLTASEL